MISALSLARISERLNGELTQGDASFTSVCIDSRQLKSGDLFVVIKGPRFDGHAFIAEAQSKGAVGAVVSEYAPVGIPLLRVADTRLALGQIAALNRAAFLGKLVAVTGSAGKTTVKEMTASILRQQFRTMATRGNLNNDIGAPLSLLEIDAEHERAVLELGASSVGEIAYTASLACPDVAVITNAADAHIEGFGSLNNVVQAKGEILDALGASGVAIINRDDLNAYKWIERAAGKQILTFSLDANAGAQYSARDISALPNGCYAFTLLTPQGEIEVTLQHMGKHNIANALAAAAAAQAVGAPLKSIKDGLETARHAPHRLAQLTGINESRLIDDSYNANPESLRAAIDVLAGYEGSKILVLGDMGELGDDARRYHVESARYARQCGIDRLYCVGALSNFMAKEFGEGAHAFNDKQKLIQAIRPVLNSGVTLLVKGSRSAQMEEVVNALTNEAN